MFAVAVVSSESRPALLRDAEWGEVVIPFNQRFSSGTPEGELLKWLADNKFDVVGENSARRTIRGLPCNESVEVSWAVSEGVIGQSSAVVVEAGCL